MHVPLCLAELIARDADAIRHRLHRRRLQSYSYGFITHRVRMIVYVV